MSTNDDLPQTTSVNTTQFWLAVIAVASTKTAPTTAAKDVAQLEDELRRLMQAYAREAVASRWIPVEARLPEPGMYVLVACAGRVLRALHAPRFTLSEDEWGEFDTGADYDEATDASYWPEGWYEVNQHEETHWQLDNEPTRWMPLPPLPKEQT